MASSSRAKLSPRKKAWLLACGLIVAGILFVGFVRKPSRDSIESHYERLLFLRNNDIWREPASFGEYFRLTTLKRYMGGNPSLIDQMKEMEDHQLALIRLGFFERREFDLTNVLTAVFFREFRTGMSNAPIDPNWFIHFNDSRTNWVRITCRKLDIDIPARIIRRLDGAGRIPAK